ncbi:MAG TPA: CopD family protein [Candidatus Acidoferrales bacterium]|nr:CopD family protein [Candidatus Acidoferrales bacterium]
MSSVAALIRFVHLSSSAFLLGSLLFHQWIARPAALKSGAEPAVEFTRFHHRQIVVARWTLLAVFLSGLAALWLQIASVTSASLAESLTPEAIGGVVFGTRYGAVWLSRAGLISILAFLLYSESASVAVQLAPLALAAALVVALAFAGHAAAGEGSWLAIQLASDGLHLFAASAWVGGLVAFVLFLRWLGQYSAPWSTLVLQQTTRRFSLLGLASVAVLIFTGFVNAWSLVGAIPPLVGTAYGKLLLLKLLLLLPLLAVAALNRFQTKPQILALGVESAAAKVRALLVRLKQSVTAEATLGLCVLVVVGWMSVTPPARHVQPDWPFSFRWSWNVAQGSAKIRSQLMVGQWLALAGIAGLGYALFRRRHRHLMLGASLVGLGYGGVVAHNALSIDAYPTTYKRPAVSYNAISVANGALLYQDACAVCHGTAGYGDGPGGKGLKPKPADLTAKHTADHTAGDLFWWLTHGVRASAMPGFGASLDEEERWDMINFLRALSYAERARQMTGLVEPDPWLVAPDFVYRTAREEGKSLRDHRGSRIVLLVLFTLPSSEARLEELDRLYARLKAENVEVLAAPNDVAAVEKLAATIRFLPLVTDGSREIFATYSLFRRSFSEQGSLPDPPVPPHMEFLIDRQGYVRARWIPRDGPGWNSTDNLLREIQRLNSEKPSAPAPDEHVH